MSPTGKLKAPPNRVILRPVEQKRKRESVGPHSAMEMKNGLWRPVYDQHEFEPEVIEQYADIIAVPDRVREQIDTDVWRTHEVTIKAGDRCLVDHTLRTNTLKVHDGDGTLRSMQYWKVYASVDGSDLIPNCRWNFLEPIMFGKPEHKDKSGVTIPDTQQRSKTYGKVKWLSESLKAEGIEEGDIVAFQPKMDYIIEFQDKEYFRIETDDILCKVSLEEVKASIEID